MSSTLDLDLQKLRAQAFDRADWTEPAIHRFHALASGLEKSQSVMIRKLCDWVLAPFSLWPFNVFQVFEECLSVSPSGSKPARGERFKTSHPEVRDSYHFCFFSQRFFASS